MPAESSIKGDSKLADEVLDDEELAQETETVGLDESSNPEDDAGKLKALIGVLKKVIGVKVSEVLRVQRMRPETCADSIDCLAAMRCDFSFSQDLANLRLSLPANLLEPQGNLEYWHYLDRPDVSTPTSYRRPILE